MQKLVDFFIDTVRTEFDKLLLFWLFIVMVALIVYSHDMNDESIHWLREIVSSVLGAMLGLITGTKIGQLQVRQLLPPPADLDNKEGA